MIKHNWRSEDGLRRVTKFFEYRIITGIKNRIITKTINSKLKSTSQPGKCTKPRAGKWFKFVSYAPFHAQSSIKDHNQGVLLIWSGHKKLLEEGELRIVFLLPSLLSQNEDDRKCVKNLNAASFKTYSSNG